MSGLAGLSRPREDQPHYGAHLGDVAHWEPYVLCALRLHGLPTEPAEAPVAGTFPTFLVGDLVVKLFGETFDGQASHSVELEVYTLLADHPEIRAPKLVATGCLFGAAPRWPYLVTTRLPGAAMRDLDSFDSDAGVVAGEMGQMTAALHKLTAPPAVRDRDLLPTVRSTAVARLRSYGMPHRLLEEVPAYLSDALPASTLVHADLTADHVFLENGRLVGIIDWGDALFADPYYELIALYLDLFRCRPPLLDAFLDAYGWDRADDFARRSLQALLGFQFNAITGVRALVDLDRIATLDELAGRLFEAG